LREQYGSELPKVLHLRGEPTVLPAAARASRQSRSRRIGSSCGRTPIASRIAFAKAGATGL